MHLLTAHEIYSRMCSAVLFPVKNLSPCDNEYGYESCLRPYYSGLLNFVCDPIQNLQNACPLRDKNLKRYRATQTQTETSFRGVIL
jgi:hypothetical protein